MAAPPVGVRSDYSVFVFPSCWCKTTNSAFWPGPGEADVFRRWIHWTQVGILHVRGRLPYWGEALRENALRCAGWLRWSCFWGYASTLEGEKQRGTIQGLPTSCRYVEITSCWKRWTTCCPEGPRGALCVPAQGPRVCFTLLWHINTEKEREKSRWWSEYLHSQLCWFQYMFCKWAGI